MNENPFSSIWPFFLYSKESRQCEVGKRGVLRKAFSQQQVPNAMNRQQMENKEWGKNWSKMITNRKITFFFINTIWFALYKKNIIICSEKRNVLPCLYLILAQDWSHRYQSSPLSLDLCHTAKRKFKLHYQPGTQFTNIFMTLYVSCIIFKVH